MILCLEVNQKIVTICSKFPLKICAEQLEAFQKTKAELGLEGKQM